MARQVVWSYEATADLEALANYIARDSEFYAASFVQEILDASHSLEMFGERGRIVPEFENSNIRELLIKEYRFIYHIEIEKFRVVILGLIHGKRNLRKLRRRRKT